MTDDMVLTLCEARDEVKEIRAAVLQSSNEEDSVKREKAQQHIEALRVAIAGHMTSLKALEVLALAKEFIKENNGDEPEATIHGGV